MKHIKLFENFKIKDAPKFAINIKGCPADKLMEILNYLETFGKLHFDIQPIDKKGFIKHSLNGKAWCWLVNYNNWFETNNITLHSIHSIGWYDTDSMEHMIDWKTFLTLSLEDSVKYMKKDVEIKNMGKEADKYNL